MKIVGAIFDKMEILNFFLCEPPLFLRVVKKTPDICKRTLDIEVEQDWSVSLSAMLGDL